MLLDRRGPVDWDTVPSAWWRDPDFSLAACWRSALRDPLPRVAKELLSDGAFVGRLLVGASLSGDALPAPLCFDHAEILTGAAGVGESLAWVSRISAKPGRADDGLDRWVVLARPEWSEERLERAPAEVCPDIERAFADLGATLGVDLPAPIHATAHRWRFALASREGGAGSMLDPASGIGMAGDWMRGTRVEDAYLSGIALAGRVLGAAAQRVHAAAACRAARLRR